MFYNFSKGLFYLFFKFICRWRVEGMENFPRSGAVVVVANHVSYWDPVVLGVALPRRIIYLAKKELFSIPFFGMAVRALGALPLERGQLDRRALRSALLVLKEQRVLGLFPEGTRSTSGELLPFASGAVSLAARSGATLVPVGLNGTRRIFGDMRSGSPCVRIGRPIDVNQAGSQAAADIGELNARLWAEVKKLTTRV